MQANFEQTRVKTRETVKALVDGRYAAFDGIFVRLMECQVDYFRCGAGLVDTFQPNIDNYRKRFPRQSVARDDDHPPSHADQPRPASVSPVLGGAASQAPAPARTHSKHDFDHAEDEVVDVYHTRPANKPRSESAGASFPAATASQTARTTSPPVPESGEDDILGFSAPAAKPAAKPSKPQPVTVSPPSGVEDFLSFGSSAPAKGPAAPANKTPTQAPDNFADFLSMPAAPNPPGAKSQHTSPQISPVDTDNDLDMLGMGGFSAPAKGTGAAGPAKVAPGVATAKATGSTNSGSPRNGRRSSFDDLFGFGGAASAATAAAAGPAAKPVAANRASVQPVGDSKLEQFIAGRQQAKLQDLYDRQAADDQRAAEVSAASDNVQAKVDHWYAFRRMCTQSENHIPPASFR